MDADGLSEYVLDFKALGAELIGSFIIVYIASLVTMNFEPTQGYAAMPISVAIALVYSVVIYLTYNKSRAHLNPAVTLGLVATKQIDVEIGFFYVISQIVGSIAAAITLNFTAGSQLLADSDGRSELGFPHISDGYGGFEAVILEFILSFILIMMFWTLYLDQDIPIMIHGLLIGGTYGFATLAAGNLTGAALNPIRVIGPALVSLDLVDQWVYWIGPIFGSITGSYLYIFFFRDINPDE